MHDKEHCPVFKSFQNSEISPVAYSAVTNSTSSDVAALDVVSPDSWGIVMVDYDLYHTLFIMHNCIIMQHVVYSALL